MGEKWKNLRLTTSPENFLLVMATSAYDPEDPNLRRACQRFLNLCLTKAKERGYSNRSEKKLRKHFRKHNKPHRINLKGVHLVFKLMKYLKPDEITLFAEYTPDPPGDD